MNACKPCPLPDVLAPGVVVRRSAAEPLIALARAAGYGLGITLVQILLACLLTEQSNLANAYVRLHRWDSRWYERIITEGYHAPEKLTPDDRGNVAFFPGHPLSAWLLKEAFGLPDRYAVLLASQLACWGFWTYLLLFFRRWRLPAGLAALGVGAVLVHPASFFLVAGYSESLFLLSVLGFLYWAERPGPAAGALAAAHGLAMTATRIVGVPLVAIPLLQAVLTARSWQRWRSFIRPVVLGGVALLGCGLFFAFCQWRFGHWDLYSKTNLVGWGVHPKYTALFSTQIFRLRQPDWTQRVIDPEYVSRLSVPVTLLLFAALAGAELWLARRRAGSGWRQRVGYVAAAWLLFYVPVSAHAARDMSSMIRFSLCVQVLLVLAALPLLQRAEPFLKRRGWLLAVAALLGLASLACQLALAYRFTHGLWVA